MVESGSQAYNDFLACLGDTIPLQGWPHFAGGLDTKTGTTGTHSLFGKLEDYEIMFHVSTMLPYTPNDPQQVERKRHLGNDIVLVLFVDSTVPYKPTMISSNFIHVAIVVQPIPSPEGPEPTHYRVWCVSKESVEDFGPALPRPSLFRRDQHFRNFLYAKSKF